jgi:hypothetical protein
VVKEQKIGTEAWFKFSPLFGFIPISVEGFIFFVLCILGVVGFPILGVISFNFGNKTLSVVCAIGLFDSGILFLIVGLIKCKR